MTKDHGYDPHQTHTLRYQQVQTSGWLVVHCRGYKSLVGWIDFSLVQCFTLLNTRYLTVVVYLFIFELRQNHSYMDHLPLNQQNYSRNAKLKRFYKVLSTNNDGKTEFISTMEGTILYRRLCTVRSLTLS